MFNIEITKIEFDLSSDDEVLTPEILESLDVELQAQFVGQTYTFEDVDDADDHIADLVSDQCGWCVKSVEYVEV